MPPKRKPKEVASGMINFYDKLPKELIPKVENPNERLHKITIPFRAVVVGPSGSGKTSWLMNLIHLFSQGKGTFASICIVTANSDEPLYKFLQKQDDQIKVVEGIHNTPKLDKFDKTENHLVVWDDLVLSKHLDVVCNYYIRARKQSVSCVFISQSYFHTPLMIRKNCNYLILLKMSGQREISAILRECGLGITKEQLIGMYQHATSTKMSALIVDYNVPEENRFRKGFLEIINANDFLQPAQIEQRGRRPNDYYSEDSSSEDDDDG